MIGDLSALECLKDYNHCLKQLIYRMEGGARLQPRAINLSLLLKARDCLASARTEEHYINKQEATLELPDQDIS